MRYRRIQERHFVRLLVTGRLTGHDGAGIRTLIAEIRQGAGQRHLLDLTSLDFIDSAGIGLLLVVNGEAVAANTALAIIVGSGRVGRIIARTHVGMIIPQYESIAAYVDACVPEEVLVPPCPLDENPMALAARALMAHAA